MIQQNVAGRPVTVFRFPPRTRLKALSHATVSANIPILVVIVEQDNCLTNLV